MGCIFVPAEARHHDWIAAAQAQTAMTSYGRPLPKAEAAALSQRLDAAFGAACARILVLEDDHAPIGYFWIEARQDGLWFLLDIWIAPTQRGQGHGRIVLREALRQAHARGGRQVRLAVAARNTQAYRLFAAEGFRITDTQLRDASTWFEMGKAV